MHQRKIALVTGASRGLGRSAAEHLARRGHDLVFTYRTGRAQADALVETLAAHGAKAVALALDVGDGSAFPGFADAVRQALAQHWQRTSFDLLVNNAGHGVHAPFADTSEAQFDELYRVHLKGPYFLTQALLPLLADGGSIVNVSTGLTRFALPGHSAYAAMKGAIEVLSRYQAKELGPRGIRVNTVAPGAIATDFAGGVVRDQPQINGYLAGNTALGRVGEADDIGALVAALAADDARWVNGQRIEASGGMFL
jgi:NAD(P)-dependent dehydrogenase (short-subunit alcohol dehydrogenase family)